MIEQKRIRPAGNGTDSESNRAGGSRSILPPSADSDPIDVTGVISGVYVVVVRVEGAELRYRRRLFLSLHSAEKAARRAEQRGQVVEVVLCQLTPVGVSR